MLQKRSDRSNNVTKIQRGKLRTTLQRHAGGQGGEQSPSSMCAWYVSPRMGFKGLRKPVVQWRPGGGGELGTGTRAQLHERVRV